MRLVYATGFALAAALLFAPVSGSAGQDKDRAVAGGGISAPGWKGKIDPNSAKQGRTINDSKFVKQGNDLHLTIGPAAVYWDPANVAKGDFTAKASFKEGKTVANHPHPYGVFIGGSSLDSDQPNLMYCVAYGDGSFLIRRFGGGTVTDVAKRQPNAAVHKTAADGSTSNDVAWNVKGSKVECAINGTTVASLDKGEVVGPGKLESTDGVVGIRVSHNVDVVVSNFGVSK